MAGEMMPHLGVTATDVSASMRPRHYGRGNVEKDRQEGKDVSASMRPRHYGRGNRGALAGVLLHQLASMRPRHYGRGNRALKPPNDNRSLWTDLRALPRFRSDVLDPYASIGDAYAP